jgi:hypothetical protein
MNPQQSLGLSARGSKALLPFLIAVFLRRNSQLFDFKFCDFCEFEIFTFRFSFFVAIPLGAKRRMPQNYFSIALRLADFHRFAPLRIATFYATDPVL